MDRTPRHIVTKKKGKRIDVKQRQTVKSKVLKSQLYTGDLPPSLDLTKVIAAQGEIDQLPYGSENPKAILIAKKYGLKKVPR